MFRSQITKLLCLAGVLLLAATASRANNIQVSNTTLTDFDVANGFVKVRFDLSWENSWRHPFSTGINNWDAAWVFVKYRTPVSVGGDGLWKHARLHNEGHEPGTGMTADAGLLTPESAWNASTNPALGVFIYRSEPGRGDIDLQGVKLRWNYGDNGLASTDLVEIQVFAIEMVYVPQGAFFVGSGGTESGSFTDGSWTAGATIPLSISSENALAIGQSAGNLWGTSSTGTSTIGGAGTLPAAYPKGFSAFYVMKYSITQQQYVDFLNTLTRAQQNNRTATNLAVGVTSVSNRYVMSNTSSVSARNGIRVDATLHNSHPVVFYCDLNANGTGGEADDGQWIAMNFMSWMDGAAFMDWSGLRPMTELEYEKAARGFAAPVPEENAWGTTTVSAAMGISNAGANNETASNAGANAVFDTAGTGGPLRVGAFASTGTTRAQAGASYWGIMDLSGNLWEWLVTVGNADGRTFTGLHGDGVLSGNGHATVTSWPGLAGGQVTGATGSGFRGGGWASLATRLRLADRSFAASATDIGSSLRGFRGVRSAGCVNDAAVPNFDTSGGLSPNQASVGQLLTYKVSGTGSHLWVVPNNWLIVAGKGTNEIKAVAGTFPATIRVAEVNSCGAGAEASLLIESVPQ